MSITITDDCINCGACEPECPNHAIYEGGKKWKISDGTSLCHDTLSHNPIKKDTYFIVSEKCTECVGFHEEPQCVLICPMNCCIKDDQNIETKENLLKKKLFLHDAKK
ncbi:4Fe-4S binding protein [Blattabacterium cuenoti]|uniref:4Fe-4S binding protein n=1 Tax=Blattabacterium cuenoti TaxID=1653831 RepID=UPI00163C61AC|nr:4Fe-4S binding protein [Blattabacterium cuenoti]